MKGLVGLALLLWASPAAGQNAEEIAGRASRVYRSLSSIRADFTQLIEDRMIGNQESRGSLIQAGNANLVMRFSDPKGDMILLDGTYVWVYTPSTTPGQVIRMALPSDPVYGPNVLARILDKPTERYQIHHLGTEVLSGRTVDAVEFVPLSPDPLFSKAVIWTDRQDALPRRLVLNELSGQRRTLDLSNIRVNVPVSRSTFVFDVPPGVRVVDR